MKYAAIIAAHAIDQLVSSRNTTGETVICSCGRHFVSTSRTISKMDWAVHVSWEMERLLNR